MTEETKKLFNAPWEADVCCEIHDKNESLVCICCPGEPHIANRLARLPELYDALAEVMYEGCDNCCRAHDPNLGQTFDHFMDEGCPFDQRDCFFGKYWAILRKVRDGK